MKGEIFEWDFLNYEVIFSLNGYFIWVYVRNSMVGQVWLFQVSFVIMIIIKYDIDLLLCVLYMFFCFVFVEYLF